MSKQGLSASERIACLLDDSSFVEVGAYVEARSTDFNINDRETPKDGVITGYGLIGEKLVYVYSQDASVLGGAIGEMHAKNTCVFLEVLSERCMPRRLQISTTWH